MQQVTNFITRSNLKRLFGLYMNWYQEALFAIIFITRSSAYLTAIRFINILRYADAKSSFSKVFRIGNVPKDKTKGESWWSVYCAAGVSGIDLLIDA